MADPRELVAAAFGLGEPVGGLQPIQVSSYETWRLDTARGSYIVKRLWSGADPSWRQRHEISMELERRARQAGITTAVPVRPVEPAFGWAARVGVHGVWRAYEWVEHSKPAAGEVGERWFGDTLALLHTLYPLGDGCEPEWRWLGVHPSGTWNRWLTAAARAGKPWAATAEAGLGEVLAVTDHLRQVYETATDHIVSHLDFGPWNLLETTNGLVLIDWDSAGPTTATAELGRAVAAFAEDDPGRMRRLVEAYQVAGGVVAGRAEDLFSWQLTQHLSGLTERIKIALGDLTPEDDPSPIWMTPATIDDDIVQAIVSLPRRQHELSALATRVVKAL
jgi:phosphotransferase family enzyme